jgi:hypothetical protein
LSPKIREELHTRLYPSPKVKHLELRYINKKHYSLDTTYNSAGDEKPRQQQTSFAYVQKDDACWGGKKQEISADFERISKVLIMFHKFFDFSTQKT